MVANRLEIELETGEIIRLRAQGAGRWTTTVSVIGDLHEVTRLVESTVRVPSDLAHATLHQAYYERPMNTLIRPSVRITGPAFIESRAFVAFALQVIRMRHLFHVFPSIFFPATTSSRGRR
jgi:hypothetical protein